MNTQKQVMSKIAQIHKEDKVELAEVQKTQLSLIADLTKAQAEAEKLYNDAKQMADKAEDSFQKAKRVCDKNLQRLEQLQKETFNAVMDARQVAKELGFDALPKEMYDRQEDVANYVRIIPRTNLGSIFAK
jgi:ABC-type transporter Mla subunit MlaD